MCTGSLDGKNTLNYNTKCMVSEGINVYKFQCQFQCNENCEIKCKLYASIRMISMLFGVLRKIGKMCFNTKHREYSINVFLIYLKNWL